MHARLENDSCVTRRRAPLKYTGFTVSPPRRFERKEEEEKITLSNINFDV